MFELCLLGARWQRLVCRWLNWQTDAEWMLYDTVTQFRSSVVWHVWENWSPRGGPALAYTGPDRPRVLDIGSRGTFTYRSQAGRSLSSFSHDPDFSVPLP